MTTPAAILIVDDDERNLLALEAILDRPEWSLIKASSGEGAIRLLDGQKFSVILLDVNMPGMDGFELAKFIRERQAAVTPIVFLTAYDSDRATIERAYSLGAVDYLVKPVIPAILRAKVAAFVEMDRLHRDLEKRVEERTQELAASNAALQEADRRKNDFLAMLSHELRNPLSSIRNSVELLHLVESSDRKLSYSRDVIERQTRNLSRIVDDLLDVSRITFGKIVLRKDVVSIQDAVAQAIEMTRSETVARNQVLSLDLGDEKLAVVGDMTRLSQVFANLLNNASKFSEEGGQITVSVTKDGEVVLIRVSDAGIGIDEAQLPRVFDLFAQGSVSLARSDGGLGIGLTLVKSLVEMHSGRVSAASPGLGKGAEFCVCLPLASANLSAGDQDKRPSTPAVLQRILVVDDNLDGAETLSMLLRAHGHEVQSAFDGPTAVLKAAEFRPHVVFLDIGLPGMSGYEVAGQIRDIGPMPPLLIAITGYGQNKDREKAMEAGFHAHLTKPVEPSSIMAILAQVRDAI